MLEEWIGKTVTGQGMQIAFVQFAVQARITGEAPKVGVNRIFVPANTLLGICVYGNTGEVFVPREGYISLWDDNSPWQKRPFDTRAARA
jgi:hypothetical protein